MSEDELIRKPIHAELITGKDAYHRMCLEILSGTYKGELKRNDPKPERKNNYSELPYIFARLGFYACALAFIATIGKGVYKSMITSMHPDYIPPQQAKIKTVDRDKDKRLKTVLEITTKEGKKVTIDLINKNLEKLLQEQK